MLWLAWIERAKPVAYGRLGLRPWEFGQLTIREFNEMVAGWVDREERKIDREASWVVALLNGAGHLKKPLTKDELLGRSATPAKGSAKERADAARRARIEERRQRAQRISR